MKMHIDHSVYPDLDTPPTELLTLEAKADYLHRICGAWDLGISPDAETFDLFSQWRDVFDSYALSTSPAYHAFRLHYGWEPISWPKGIMPPTPRWEHQDRIEGRENDPCENMI